MGFPYGTPRPRSRRIRLRKIKRQGDGHRWKTARCSQKTSRRLPTCLPDSTPKRHGSTAQGLRHTVRRANVLPLLLLPPGRIPLATLTRLHTQLSLIINKTCDPRRPATPTARCARCGRILLTTTQSSSSSKTNNTNNTNITTTTMKYCSRSSRSSSSSSRSRAVVTMLYPLPNHLARVKARMGMGIGGRGDFFSFCTLVSFLIYVMEAAIPAPVGRLGFENWEIERNDGTASKTAIVGDWEGS